MIVARAVPGGPAARAGLQPSNVITAVNAKPTPTLADLQDVLAGLQPGDSAKITVTRANGTHQTLDVTVEELTTP